MNSTHNQQALVLLDEWHQILTEKRKEEIEVMFGKLFQTAPLMAIQFSPFHKRDDVCLFSIVTAKSMEQQKRIETLNLRYNMIDDQISILNPNSPEKDYAQRCLKTLKLELSQLGYDVENGSSDSLEN